MSTQSAESFASKYAARGWPVFPCHSPTPGGCSCCQPKCSSPGKHPRTNNGFKNASTDPAAVRAWWRQWPNANIGLVTGRASGLLVVDIDPRHGGIDSMQQLVSEHGALQKGMRVRTGSGGWHLFFEHPDRQIRNSVNHVGQGIDVRADGGYVIAPPSTHSAGDRYMWTRTEPPGSMPDWLEALVDPPRPEPKPLSTPLAVSNSTDKWAAAAVRGEVDRVRTSPEGCRNHTLNRAAFSLGQIVGAGAIDSGEVESQLHHAAIAVGLGEREATLTIRSGLAAGLARPRGPAEPAPMIQANPIGIDEVEAGLP